MAVAVFKQGSRQYRVTKGEKLAVDFQKSRQAGDTVEFSEVLQLTDGDTIKVGQPTIEGAKVVARVVEHVRDHKVTSFKYKRRKRWSRTRGHKQRYTIVEITDINAS